MNTALCDQCGNTFTYYPYRKSARFCSRECYEKHQRGKPKKKRTEHRYAICRVCKQSFTYEACRKWDAHYCSKACWSSRSNESIKCAHCGIQVYSSVSDHRRYCSRSCYALHKQQTQKGSRSHFWKGGKTKQNQVIRSSAQYKNWRSAVFTRDRFTCQKCGAQKVYMHAHHIKPFSTHIALRFDVNNGITLCTACHKKEHSHSF